MENLDLKQTCLLEVSGELTHAARKEFLEHISNDPNACRQYETVRGHYAVLGFLPIPEPSAEERRRIPAQIKRLIHSTRLQPAKKAFGTKTLIRCAAAALIAGITSFAVWSSWSATKVEMGRSADQIARISAATERVLPPGHKPGAYELAVTDVEASIRQLETESPTLSNVYDKNLANLLDALATVPQVYDGGDWAGDEQPLP